MDGDMNDIFQKLNTILEDKDMSNNLKNILNNFSSSNDSDNSSESSNNKNSSSFGSYNNKKDSGSFESNNTKNFDGSESSQKMPEFDINMILKIKTIMDSLNKNSDDPRSNLLLSLKPYLGDNKKEKIDQYVKFLQFAKVLEVLNPMGGDTIKNE
ncbi:MAG: hypothetical protein J6A89_00130 [Clostridia bacterium]|nr:hypothetical protein [Clostridia bacterium]